MSASMLTSALPVNEKIRARVDRLELPFNRFGVDPYGIDKDDLAKLMTLLGWFYENYFEVEVHGIGNIPARGRAMLVGNHSGGVAIDAMMLMASCFLEMEPPRLAQGMVEKFLGQIPGLAQLAGR